MKNPRFGCKQGKDGKYYFNLIARNGEVILTSQGYTSRSALRVGVESTKRNAMNIGSFELLKTTSREPYFVLKASNGEIVGRSEVYSSKEAMHTGVNAVMANAPEAEIEWEDQPDMAVKS